MVEMIEILRNDNYAVLILVGIFAFGMICTHLVGYREGFDRGSRFYRDAIDKATTGDLKVRGYVYKLISDGMKQRLAEMDAKKK